MKRSCEVYGRCLRDKIISDEELELLKKVEINMLEDFINLCDEYSIKYYMAYGTLLGAVRHKGFIPWDDDLDIFIYKKDLNNLKNIINTYYKDKYYILDDEIDRSYSNNFPKLIMKNTTLIEAVEDNEKKFKKGIYIDLFLIDNRPKHFLKLRNYLFFLSSAMIVTGNEFKYPSNILREASLKDKELKSFLRKRKIIGFISYLFSIRFWRFLFKLSISGKKDQNKFVVLCEKKIMEIDSGLLLNNILYDFEGLKVLGFKNYDEYLSNEYGSNYMELPPVNERVKHIIIKLDFNH